MKIQDQINQWMQVRKEVKKDNETSIEPEAVSLPKLLSPPVMTLMLPSEKPEIAESSSEPSKNKNIIKILQNFKKLQEDKKIRPSIDLKQQISLQKLKLKLLQDQQQKKENQGVKSDLKRLLKNIEKYKSKNQDKTGELSSMYS
jgi:hypothetical protein